MPLPEKRWTLPDCDPLEVARLQQELKIDMALARLLVLRGISDYNAARLFFNPSLEHLHDPFLMKGMAQAVNRLTSAMAAGEAILIYGDYDVDGTTAIACVYTFLKKIYPKISYYVPHRYREGYGISMQSIDYAAEKNIKLMIALDCGIRAVEQVAYARSKGIDMIICDHHLPGPELPQALALLDPKQQDCTYPFKELSGCGVGFKLLQAFCIQQGLPQEMLWPFLDLLAVSIACDIVPIIGENRILAFHGLKQLNTAPQPGLKQLLELAGAPKTMTITDVVFLLGPRINAAGRIDDARSAADLLIGEGDARVLLEGAIKLQQLNAERKTLDQDISAEALAMVESDPDLLQRTSTVVYHPEWHKGVVGIVASRLVERIFRPTIVLTSSGQVIGGSARSVPGFDLYEALYECRDLLLQFGGHRAAAGLTLEKENLEAFREKFESVVARMITPEQRIPEIVIDTEISLDQLTDRYYRTLQRMAPFGPGNMKPMFVVRQVKDSGYSRILKEHHLRLSIRKADGELIQGIGFGLAEKWEVVKNGYFDCCFHLEENEFRNQTTLQLMVKDIRPSLS
ncbi:MAG: single-stranded-DNA-specific exonuclease RecJ [Chitinophagales bacterium]